MAACGFEAIAPVEFELETLVKEIDVRRGRSRKRDTNRVGGEEE